MKSKHETPARQCPRFNGCNVNRCPLDLLYPNQPMDKDDKEKCCPMEKGVRLRIAAAHPGQLKHAGRTVAEHSAWLNWERKPLADKIKQAERAKSALLKLRPPNDVVLPQDANLALNSLISKET